MSRATIIVRLPIRLKKKAKWVVASCDVFDVHSQGATDAEARKNIKEAVGIFVKSCFERGTLEAVLKECGFELVSEGSRKHLSREKDTISVPIPFITRADGRVPCHV